MTKKQFFNKISNGKKDVILDFITQLKKTKTDYCVIGGLAVNAYAEPVVSLDLDLVIAVGSLEVLIKKLKNFKIKKFTHSLNLYTKDSDLRIQIQTDVRYQDFLQRAAEKEVLGYRLKVASIEDVLKGKAWAYEDKERRASKRQKDLADIFRMLEVKPELLKLLPESIRKQYRN